MLPRQAVRHPYRKILGLGILFWLVLVLTAPAAQAQDPLPSWNDDPAKQAQSATPTGRPQFPNHTTLNS
ncbi:MAG: hypothetical protein ACOC6L_03765 [Thermodesulfobacteriota bacterium]